MGIFARNGLIEQPMNLDDLAYLETQSEHPQLQPGQSAACRLMLFLLYSTIKITQIFASEEHVKHGIPRIRGRFSSLLFHVLPHHLEQSLFSESDTHNAVIHSSQKIRDHSFSTYAKFFEKLTHTYVCTSGSTKY